MLCPHSIRFGSTVLFWYHWISWRATVPGWYLWGFFNGAALHNSFQGAFHLTMGFLFFLSDSFLAGTDSPASAAICTSCQLGDDLGDLPTSSSCFSSSHLLSSSPGEGKVCWTCDCTSSCACASIWASIPEHNASVWARACVLTWYPLSHPPLDVTFILAMLEWKSNKLEVLAGFSEDTCYFHSTSCKQQRFYIFIGRFYVTKADNLDQISCVLEWEEREFQEAMRAEVGTASLCTPDLSKMEFLKVFTGADIMAQYTEMEESKFLTRSVPGCY